MLEAQAQAAIDALEKLQRLALAECGYSPREPVPAALSINWHPGLAAEDLVEQTLQQTKTLLAASCELRTGRVYCYHCENSDCEHAAPESMGQVFVGYQATGRPIWEEFCNYLLAQKDERVDLLFAEKNSILSRLTGRPGLIAEQLTTYGRSSQTYLILGQVTFGYLPIRSERAALTFQVITTREQLLRTQLIATEPVLHAIEAAFGGSDDPLLRRVAEALRETTQRIESLNVKWRHCHSKQERSNLKNKLFSQLRELATKLERKGRQAQRRTNHAEIRSQEQRPVHKAYQDLQEATAEDFFLDKEKDSVIVLGKNGRTHVYSQQGRHITSFLLNRQELEGRQRRNRYLPLTVEDIRLFRLTSQQAEMPPESTTDHGVI